MSDAQSTEPTRKDLLRKRVYAFYTDLIIIAVLQKFLVITYLNCVRELLTTLPGSTESHLMSHTYELTLPTLAFTLFTYFFCNYYFNHGTTLGKTIFDLRVYNARDLKQELSLGECFTRSLVYTCCYLGGGILLALPLLRRDARGFPDFFSRTQVTTRAHYQTLVQKKLATQTQEEKQLPLFLAS